MRVSGSVVVDGLVGKGDEGKLCGLSANADDGGVCTLNDHHQRRKLLHHRRHTFLIPSIGFSERRSLGLVSDEPTNIGNRLCENRLERRDLHDEGCAEVRGVRFPSSMQCDDAISRILEIQL